MKTLLALLVIGSAKLMANDDILFLKAISMVESGEDDNAVGPCGAVGRYQMLPATWRLHSDWPIDSAKNYSMATAVALTHLKWLRKTMEVDRGFPADYRDIACAWLRGPSWYKRTEGNHRMVVRMEYAARVMNLFNELKTKP